MLLELGRPFNTLGNGGEPERAPEGQDGSGHGSELDTLVDVCHERSVDLEDVKR